MVAGCGLLTRLLPSHRELVVHSTEWATGSRLFRAFAPVAAFSRGFSAFSQLPPPHSTQKARARPGLSQFLKLLEAVLALGQTLLGRFLA